MATASFTWQFTASAQGLADVGDDANLDSQFIAGDGNPAGSLEWLQSAGAASAGGERSRDSVGGTWAAIFGIPTNAVVSDVQVASWHHLNWQNANVTGFRTRIRFVDATGASVHSAGDLVDVTTSEAASGFAVTHGAGTSRAVDAAFQAATSSVRLEIQLSLTASGTPNVDWEHDNIAVTITYTVPAAVPSVPLPQALLLLLRPMKPFGAPIFPQIPAPVLAQTVLTALIGQALEADTALPLGKVKGLLAATETDVAVAVGRVHSRALGTAVETDTGGAVAHAKARTVGTAPETDTAPAVGRVKTKPLALAAETDTAITLGRLKRRALGVATEADTAIAVTRAKARLAGVATETDTAGAIGRLKRKLIGIAPETDTATSITKSGSKSALLGISTESDIALAVGRVKTKAVTVALETDAALTIGRLKRRPINAATEADAALALTRAKSRTLGTATATNLAVALVHRKTRQLGAAFELDTAGAISTPVHAAHARVADYAKTTVVVRDFRTHAATRDFAAVTVTLRTRSLGQLRDGPAVAVALRSRSV